MADWQDNLVESREGMAAILKDTRRIAVLGIKTEAQSDQPAFYVPQYMAEAGYEIVPVPVYYPDVTEILGEPVYRRSRDIPPHLSDILAAKPKSVWFQLGIRNDEVAETLARAGIKVVQDR